MKSKMLIAYCNTAELPNIIDDDIKRLTSIHISFGLINKWGEVYWNQRGTEGVLEKIRRINPDINIVLSIGGWGADGFSQAAATEEGRVKFAKTAVKIMEENHMDGIDIDWEYPCSSQAEIASSPNDKETFTLLICELRRQIDACRKGQTLSVAVGALRSCVENTDMREVQKYLDYVQLMTYDFHGVFTPTTGHHANLYDDTVIDEEKISAERTVEMYAKAGVPIEKMVMGAAFYGRCWNKVPAEHFGLGQVAEESGVKGCPYSLIQEFLQTGEGGFTYHWDEDAKAAYLYNGDTFISFEDKRALSLKVDYVKKHNMAGIMFWEYSEDQTRSLVGHLYQELTNN